ncbi:hypothetical protein [Ruminococcus bromii]
MAKINELREKRAKIWEQAKAFLDSHRNETVFFRRKIPLMKDGKGYC